MMQPATAIHESDPNDPYTITSTLDISAGQSPFKVRVDGGVGSVDEVVNCANKLWAYIDSNRNTTLAELGAMAEFKNFIRAYPIIARLIVEAKMYHGRGFRKYLKDLAKNRRTIGGIDTWHKDHREYAKSQISYIKFILAARNIRLNSPEVRKYLQEMEQQIEEDIKIIKTTYERVKAELGSGDSITQSITQSMRDELRRMAAVYHENQSNDAGSSTDNTESISTTEPDDLRN